MSIALDEIAAARETEPWERVPLHALLPDWRWPRAQVTRVAKTTMRLDPYEADSLERSMRRAQDNTNYPLISWCICPGCGLVRPVHGYPGSCATRTERPDRPLLAPGFMRCATSYVTRLSKDIEDALWAAMRLGGWRAAAELIEGQEWPRGD